MNARPDDAATRAGEPPRAFADLFASLPEAAPAQAAEAGAHDEELPRLVQKWAARRLDDAAIERAKCIPPSVLAELRELGLFGLTLPEAYGGAALSLATAAEIIEHLAYFDRSTAVTVGLHAGLGTRGLVQFGAAALRERYLPDLAAGARIAAFAATEPEAGSHIAAVRTTAAKDGRGNVTVSGDKCFVTNGAMAGLFTVLTRTPAEGSGRHGTALVVVPREVPGVRVGPEEHKLGLCGSSTTSVFFDGATVGAEHVLGRPGGGHEQFGHVLAWGRTLMAAGAIGAAQRALVLAARHTATRRQFGRPLAAAQAVRRELGLMHLRVVASRALVGWAAQEDGAGDAFRWLATAAKVFVSEAAWRVIDRALQLHGGSGFIETTGVARILRDCRVTRIFEGANEPLRQQLALEILLGWRGAPRLDMTSALADATARRDFHARVAVWADLAEELRRRHGVRLAEQQAALGHFADATLALLAEAAVWRAAPASGSEALRLAGRHFGVELGVYANAARQTDDAALAATVGDVALAKFA